MKNCRLCNAVINGDNNYCSKCCHKIRQAKYGINSIIELLKRDTAFEQVERENDVLIAS